MAQILGSKGGIMEYEEPHKSEVKVLLDRALKGDIPPEESELFEIGAIGRINRFVEGEVSWQELHQYFVRNAQLRQVSLDVTNRCNLKCEHCFYTAESDEVSTLTFREWQGILDQIYKQGVKTVTIAGKEPFISRQTTDILQYLDELKTRNQHPFQYGIVTNGTLLHRFVDDLAKLEMDYLDVSIDGLQVTHDRFRGRGTFDKAMSNLRMAIDSQVARKIFVASVLHQQNDTELLDLVEYSCNEGITHFIIGLFFPTPHTPDSLTLTDETLIGFIGALEDWASTYQAGRHIEVVIDYNSTVLCYLPLLFERGILSLEKIFVDQSGNFYAKSVHAGGVSIFIEFPPFIEFSYWGVGRIKDGLYMGGCEPLSRKGEEWREFTVGNILEESLDAIYHRALDVHLGDILRSIDIAARTQEIGEFRYTLGGDHFYTSITKGGGLDYVWEQKNLVSRHPRRGHYFISSTGGVLASTTDGAI